MILENKTAAVIGLARAGIPAAKFLAQKGARVKGYDSKSPEQFAPKAELENLGIELHLGEHNFAGIDECDLIVLSPGLKIHFEPLQSLIEKSEARGAEVIGELELASRFCPCSIIGITGTKGKSTTTKLVTEMLRACGVDAHSAGNTGTPLIEMLPQLSPESWAVVEVSSFQLEKAPTFKPKIAVLLSLLEDHQDFHPTLEQYWETKLGIFANQTDEDWAIFNVDDERVLKAMLNRKNYFDLPTTRKPYKEITSIPWLESVFDTDEKYIATIEGAPSEQKIIVFGKPFSTPFSTKKFPLRGEHNLSNLASAISAVVLTGALNGENFVRKHPNVDAIQSVIDTFQSLPHRLEIVARKDGVTYVNDSQSTIPDATIAALKSFPAPVTLLVGGRAKIEAVAYENLMCETASAGARIVLFGEAAEMLEKVALSTGVEKSRIFRENVLAEALRIAKMHSAFGETIVLSPACASFDQFSSYEHRGQIFRELVEKL